MTRIRTKLLNQRFVLFHPDVSFKNFPLRDETAVGTGSVSVLDTTELLDEDHGYPDYPGIVNLYLVINGYNDIIQLNIQQCILYSFTL